MTEETKKLITAVMLSDVLGENCENVVITSSGRIAFHANGFEFRISEAELKDKLETWLDDNSTCGVEFWHNKQGGYWISQLDGINEEAETKLEALLKLYHAVKGE